MVFTPPPLIRSHAEITGGKNSTIWIDAQKCIPLVEGTEISGRDHGDFQWLVAAYVGLGGVGCWPTTIMQRQSRGDCSEFDVNSLNSGLPQAFSSL